jgi:hypothetical protein
MRKNLASTGTYPENLSKNYRQQAALKGHDFSRAKKSRIMRGFNPGRMLDCLWFSAFSEARGRGAIQRRCLRMIHAPQGDLIPG